MIDFNNLHRLEAEQSVIGGVMLKNSAWDDVAEIVSEDDFFNHHHKIIFSAMRTLQLKNHPLDYVTLSAKLNSEKTLDEIGGESYLLELLKNTPTAANIKSYAGIVKKLSLRRQMIIAANKAIEAANDLEREDFIEIGNRCLDSVTEHIANSLRYEDVYAKTTLAEIIENSQREDASTYLRTGITALDDLIHGFDASSYIILAARPSMGKTMLAMNIVDNIVERGKSALFFSLETTAESLQYRRLARKAVVQLSKIKNPKKLNDLQITNLINATQSHEKQKLAIDDSGSRKVTTNYIRAICRRVKKTRGLDFVVIDFIQLISATEGDNDVNKLSYVSRDLRALAKELNVPLLVLSQLNRNVESRAEKRPVMSDLKQSGALEQDANMIIFIDRPCRYAENKSADPKLANIYVEKNKDGATGDIRLSFEGELCEFGDYSPPLYEAPMQSRGDAIRSSFCGD